MMDKALLYAILKNKSGAEISASGNPVTLSGTLADNPLEECKIYGWSKQESTTGKNLFDFSCLESDGVNVMDYEKQTITVPAKTNNTGYNQTLRDLCPGIVPGTYVFSMKRSNPESVSGSYFLEISKDFPINTPIELTDAHLDSHISWYNGDGLENENVISEIQIEAGNTVTDYEPYTGGQPSPSPEYPQEIVSAGVESAGIAVTVHGKNLFDLEYALKQENWIAIPGRYFYIPYYVGKGSTVTVSYDGKPALGLGAYILIGRKAGETGNSYGWLYHSSAQSLVNNTKTFVAEADYIYINAAADFIKMFKMYFKNFQIEVSPAPTSYEPYRTPQSLSIQTPTGLPAIPVDTGGNYTDADGQQWIADYVDLKRGKYVQRVWQKTFDGSENMGIYDDIRGFSIRDVLPNRCYRRKGFMNQQKDFSIGLGNKYLYIYKSEFYDKGLADKGLSNWKAHLAEHPLVVMTYLDEPIERDLTPSEIQAYQNLVTYAGTTIVENDADCYMEVSSGGGDALRAKKLALILGD